MCGRFALTEPREAVEELFGLADMTPFPPRYNVAPTQPIVLVIAGEAPTSGANRPARHAMLARWGFWPAWVKDPREFPLVFNARMESAVEKPAFRAAMRHRRVLVPASGFYEWKRPAKGGRAKAQAYWVRPKTGGLVAFAGLMETWAAPDGTEVDTAVILTTPANDALGSIHARMPLVILPQDFARWLDCKSHEPRQVADLMRPAAEELFEAVPVSDRINKAVNTAPDVQDPVKDTSEAIEKRDPAPYQPSLL